MVRVRRTAAALACLALLGQTGAGIAQAPANPPPAPTPADPAFEAARAAFEALPAAERQAIQDALVWTGDYNSVVTGAFGKRTYDALLAFQRRTKRDPTGVLDPRARADLLAAGQRARDAMKFALVVDPRTGVRIGIPERLLSVREANPGGGTRWRSADGKVTLDTRAIPPGETALPALFERLTAQVPGRQVTYRLIRPEFFVVTGETATGKFYVRYAGAASGLRGFSLAWDKALKDVDRIVIAVANSFTPFPEAAPAVAGAPMPSARPAGTEPPRAAGPAASGILVAPRRVLTTARCPDPRIGPRPARVLKADPATGLALLEGEDTRTPPRLTLDRSPPAGDLVVLSFTGSEPSLVATPATVVSGRLVAPLQPGASGGAVFSRSAALAGLVGALPASQPMVAGVVPPLSHAMIAADRVAAFLAESGIALPDAAASDAPRSAGEIAGALESAAVPITCGR